MEMVPLAGTLRRQWRRRGYNKLSPANRRSIKVVRIGNSGRSWRLRLAPKLRLLRLPSPLKLLRRLKDGYVNMMLGFAAKSGSSNGVVKRIPKGRGDSVGYSSSEFENRLIYEIYKSMVDSFELGYTKRS